MKANSIKEAVDMINSVTPSPYYNKFFLIFDKDNYSCVEVRSGDIIVNVEYPDNYYEEMYNHLKEYHGIQ